MLKPTNNKGVVLIIVLGTLLVVTIIGNIILSTIVSQSRLTHHQVSRIKAYYASQAGMNYAIEMLRLGNWTSSNDPSSAPKYYCINGNVDSAVSCLETITDTDIGYNVQIAIYPKGTGLNGTSRIEVKTNYTEAS